MSVSNCTVKMQVDIGADSKVMSSKIWTELGKPQLDGKIRHLEAYDGNQLSLLGHLLVTLSGTEAGTHKINWQLCSLIKNLDYLLETFYTSTV